MISTTRPASLPYLAALALAMSSSVAGSAARRQDHPWVAPALGWNGWNQGHCDAASEETALRTAQAFIDLGLKDAGYEFVNIDDCWSLMDRDGDGNLVPDPEKFPRGIKAVADDIHAMGLKFGLYGDSGTKTCAGYPGSEGYEQQDADLLASWGVDFWKYDNCYTPCDEGDDVHTCPDSAAPDSRPRYELMRDALANTGADILYSLCNWGWDEVWTWGAEVGHIWRMSTDNWGGWEDVVRIANKASPILHYTEPGRYNDLDMMIIGNGALTPAEDRTHFAIWAITKSPILHGTDMTALSSEQLELIKHAGLLAVNQDSLHEPAVAFTPDGESGPGDGEMYRYWSGPLAEGTVVALVASGSGDQTVSVNFSDVPGIEGGEHSWTELFSGREGTSEELSADLEEHDIAVFVVSN